VVEAQSAVPFTAAEQPFSDQRDDGDLVGAEPFGESFEAHAEGAG
jgi:hypothetical protein